MKNFPKVLLHDHLDGGLRPQTIIEIADEIGYTLPSTDSNELANWFEDAANSGSLVRYLETFDHTIAVMQREEDLIRVARECVLDLAADGVIYAEVRGAPELFTRGKLSIEDVVLATLEGYRQGMAETGITVNAILCGMRHQNRSQEAAELAVKYRDKGVVGFDIAGPEKGFMPTLQLDTFNYLRKNEVHYTIHAGEAAGPESIDAALNICGAERLGHGVYIVDDLPDGKLAAQILEEQIPLEVAPTSNLQTGVAKSYANHPIGRLYEMGFNVSLNTDNRLMSHTSASNEFAQAAAAFGWNKEDFRKITLNGINAAFIDDKSKFIQIIEDGYDQL